MVKHALAHPGGEPQDLGDGAPDAHVLSEATVLSLLLGDEGLILADGYH